MWISNRRNRSQGLTSPLDNQPSQPCWSPKLTIHQVKFWNTVLCPGTNVSEPITYWWVGLTPLLTKHCFPRPSMKSYWQDRGPRHFPRRISKDVPIEKMMFQKKWLLAYGKIYQRVAVLSLFSFVKYILEVSNIWGYPHLSSSHGFPWLSKTPSETTSGDTDPNHDFIYHQTNLLLQGFLKKPLVFHQPTNGNLGHLEMRILSNRRNLYVMCIYIYVYIYIHMCIYIYIYVMHQRLSKYRIDFELPYMYPSNIHWWSKYHHDRLHILW